jgi:hypothetical protein
MAVADFIVSANVLFSKFAITVGLQFAEILTTELTNKHRR